MLRRLIVLAAALGACLAMTAPAQAYTWKDCARALLGYSSDDDASRYANTVYIQDGGLYPWSWYPDERAVARHWYNHRDMRILFWYVDKNRVPLATPYGYCSSAKNYGPVAHDDMGHVPKGWW